MKNILDGLLNPHKLILTLYALFSFLLLIGYVWFFSFVWDYFISVTYTVVGLMVAILAGLFFAISIDRKFDLQIKFYFLISLSQLLFIWAIADPVRTWQIDSSQKKGLLISKKLDIYKERFGEYPATLQDLEEKFNEYIPSRTNLGTQFFYKPEGESDYRLWFHSYHGKTLHYIRGKRWITSD